MISEGVARAVRPQQLVLPGGYLCLPGLLQGFGKLHVICLSMTATLAFTRVCSLSGIRTTPFLFFDDVRYFWGKSPGMPLSKKSEGRGMTKLSGDLLPVISPSVLNAILTQASPSYTASMRMVHFSHISIVVLDGPEFVWGSFQFGDQHIYPASVTPPHT